MHPLFDESGNKGSRESQAQAGDPDCVYPDIARAWSIGIIMCQRREWDNSCIFLSHDGALDADKLGQKGGCHF